MAGTDTSAQQAAEQACDRLQLVVPDEIRRYKQWVLWRYEPGDDKPRKVPYYANAARRSGVQGSESDLAQLSTFDAAVARLRRGGFDGVGLAILPNSPIKAIDLDACVVAGKLLPQAEAIVVEADSYAEISPSGTGVRILAFGVLPSKKAMHRFGPGQHLELFGTSGFVTITGNTLGATTIRPMPAAFQSWVIQQVTGSSDAAPQEPRPAHTVTIDSTQRAHLRSALTALDADNYGVWCDMGLALKSLGDVGRSLWLEWSQLSPRFDAGQAAKKWAGFEPDGRINYQTVFYRAGDAKWVNPASAVAAAVQADPAYVLPMLSLPELEAAAQSIRWVVKHIMPADSIGVLFGASGTFKSFLALDYALTSAHGLPWLGRKTRKGAVIFIAAEGGAGLWRRIQAWHQARGLSWADIDFRVVPVALSLAKDAYRVVEAAAAVGIVPQSVIVDTMSQTFDGEENSANEVANYLRVLSTEFRALWRCCIVVVHHSGHSATERPRGSSAIRANVDFMFGVFRDEKEMLCTMECHKQKDGELFEPVSFALSSELLGHDEDGDAINSLSAKAIGGEQLAEQMLAQASAGRPGRTHMLMRLVHNGMTEKELRKAFYEELPDVKDLDAKKAAFYRARDSKVFKEHFEIAGDDRRIIVIKEYI